MRGGASPLVSVIGLWRRITTFGYFEPIHLEDDGGSAVRPMRWRSGAATLRPMNPLVLYVIFVAVAVVIALGAMVTARPIVRCCPGCDADVRLDAHACRSCGHRFA
jgi:hypothetical protein